MNETGTKSSLVISDDEQHESVSHEGWEAVVLQLCLFSLIAVVGFVANVLVLVTAYQLRRQRNLRSPRSTYYIINLAVADLAIILLALPTDLIPYFSSWPFGEFACKFLFPLRDVFVFVAIMTITGLSIERYWVITGTFKTKPNPKNARVIIVSIWIVGYLVAGLPMVFTMKLVRENDRIVVCDTTWRTQTEKRVHMLLGIACIVLPSCIITFCYVRIAKSLKRLQTRRSSDVSIEGRPTSSVISLVAQSKKVAKMLVIIVIAFCCCVLPFTLFAIVAEFGTLGTTNIVHISVIYALVISLFFAHSAVNPLILLMMSKEYRIQVQKIARAVKDVCWKADVRAFFARLAAQKEYRQHRKASDNRDQLVHDPEGEHQQKSTEL